MPFFNVWLLLGLVNYQLFYDVLVCSMAYTCSCDQSSVITEYGKCVYCYITGDVCDAFAERLRYFFCSMQNREPPFNSGIVILPIFDNTCLVVATTLLSIFLVSCDNCKLMQLVLPLSPLPHPLTHCPPQSKYQNIISAGAMERGAG